MIKIKLEDQIDNPIRVILYKPPFDRPVVLQGIHKKEDLSGAVEEEDLVNRLHMVETTFVINIPRDLYEIYSNMNNYKCNKKYTKTITKELEGWYEKAHNKVRELKQKYKDVKDIIE